MDYLISMYIDNELSIDEKVAFIEHVCTSKDFKKEALSLLSQEKTLGNMLAEKAPNINLDSLDRPRVPFQIARPLGFAIAASLLLLAVLYVMKTPQQLTDIHIGPAAYQHRFVIYQAGVSQVELAGSFTNWQPLPLQPAGSSGYWEITLAIPPGEHTFSYILDGNRILADPTISIQEKDDFGTVNSILIVEAS